jgi:hypothetical protein
MKTREFRRLLLVGLALAGLLIATTAFAAGDGAARLHESGAADIEGLLQQYVDFNGATPVFTDYGDGFYSLSATLDPAARDRLLAAVAPEGTGDKKTPVPALTLLAAGQSLSPPASPAVCIHAPLSETTLVYNYWVVVLNLGSQNVAKTTSFKLTGPGLTFNKSFLPTYKANGIWVVWYNPASSVHNPGFYTYVATVAGIGGFTSRTYAINLP